MAVREIQGKTSGWRGVLILAFFIIICLISFAPFKPLPISKPRPHHSANEPKYAFATFLSGHYGNASSSNLDHNDSLDADNYYTSVRMLAYQLLHGPVSSNLSMDFVVFITDDVSEPKRHRLIADGASVVLAGKVHSDWLTPNGGRGEESLAKLRLWQMQQYEKVCFLDADHLLLNNLDSVFADPATDAKKTLDDRFAVKADEGALPETYNFAGQSHGDATTFDAGFFVLKPNLELLGYYSSLLAAHIHGRFANERPEEGLLNYAHRVDGNMPWQKLAKKWSVAQPRKKDYDAGAAAFHGQFWRDDGIDDAWLLKRWKAVRSDMEAFWKVRDGGRP